MKLTIFSTESCPRCKLLAGKLRQMGYEPAERLMADATTTERESCITDGPGYWPRFAPLLQLDFGEFSCWYADVSLFKGDRLDEEHLKEILEQSA